MKLLGSEGRWSVAGAVTGPLIVGAFLLLAGPAAAVDVAANSPAEAGPTVSAAAEAPRPRDFRIGVLGDSLGEGVYAGLAQLVRGEPNVDVKKYAKVNTGIARSDRYDWPEAADDLAEKPMDVALLVFGANDLQTIRESGKAYYYKQAAWEERYRKRVAHIVKAFAGRGVKVYWLSLPITRKNRFQADYAYLNEIFRQEAEANGATFIDAWKAFADENGEYTTNFTVDGKSTIIRASDGVHFTPLGYQVYAGLALDRLRQDLNF
ncbi:DUF459 domain-containing protein [Jiella avicenniae]|uniref:DUF459 domain-containing protein n=1 Tax=Jiella avicenniae TaxID=2907202 RepID=A0A9X1P0Q5_9HYPH|nr:DUF459 domain-containing protein [Jiella avicenniae]MCE7028205.1 DUF459 domain-containing protein [Jiella avicenniae]